jgi:hypothetical protein
MLPLGLLPYWTSVLIVSFQWLNLCRDVFLHFCLLGSTMSVDAPSVVSSSTNHIYRYSYTLLVLYFCESKLTASVSSVFNCLKIVYC